MTRDLSRRLRKELPDIVEVVARFPLAVIATSLLTAYFLFDYHLTAEWVDGARGVRIPAALSAIFLWSTAAVLYAEAQGHSARAGHLAAALGNLVIALVFAAWDATEPNPVALMAALAAGLTVAAFTRRAPDNGAFWLFNHNLWLGWAIAFVALLLFAGGLSAIVETLRYLFGLAVPESAHRKIWTIAGAFVAPVYALSLTPRDSASRVTDGEPADFIGRSLAVLVKFVLVPLLLVYAAILHVYFITIMLDMSLPKGRLGNLVLSYGVVLAATVLAAYPSRMSGGLLVRLFWRIWPLLLVVPLGLLFVAVATRIRQYGLTEQRYLVVLAGLWLGALIVTQGVGRAWREPERRDLRFMPGVAAVLLAFAAFGPSGMSGWPVRNQAAEFKARLAAAGMLMDGRIPPDVKPATTLLASDGQRLHGVIDYLSARGRLAALQPLFEGQTGDPFVNLTPAEARRGDRNLAERIRLRVGIGPHSGGPRNRAISYYSPTASAIAVDGGLRLVGPLAVGSTFRNRDNAMLIKTPDGALSVWFEKNVLNIADATGQTTRFGLASLAAPGGPIDPDAPSPITPPANRPALPLRPIDATSRATLVITSISGRRNESDEVEISHLSGWLVLPPAR